MNHSMGGFNLNTGEWVLNETYTEIFELSKLLSENMIPHEIRRNFDGWIVIYYDKYGNKVGDAIETFGSFGSDQNLLEVYGFDLEDVEGYLTAREAFEHFRKAYERRCER